MDEESVLLEAVLKLDPAERTTYLKQACAGNDPLRHSVAGLIEAHEKAGSFLEEPAYLAQTVAIAEITEKPGDRIGHYKLLEQIGEGGMGIVYMAEQTEPVKRRVALKIIKPGMDTKQVVARFEAERQALALMDHANIAKVLDGGATESPLSPVNTTTGRRAGAEGKEETSPLSLGRGARGEGEEAGVAGRPYFVMELVRGIPITEYCDKQKLTTTERLKLFITVCKAVQHAHLKGIIHRDIKPSNILVSVDDGVAVPKVIDFGVAKAINQELTEQTLFTNFATMIGTPLYMSPEQAEMTNLDIDTRSDIYSLGVLLYELLTGSTPFEREKLKQAGYDEMRRIIREEEPPNPSTRISTLGEMITTVSEKRGTDPRKLSQTVRGDLDWIVMKALEKDRNRRYESASAFAADVNRYLNDEPIGARPPSTVYRLKKFARRNKPLITTVFLVAASLLIGTAVSIWQAIRATQAEQVAAQDRDRALEAEQVAAQDRDRALEAEKRAEANLRLAFQAVDEMYTDVAGEHLADKPHMTPLQRDVLEKALKFYQEFARDNITNSDVRQETARAYRRVGDIRSKLGQHSQAEEAYNEAITLLEKLTDDFPGQPVYRHNLAASYNNLGVLLKSIRRFKESENVHQEALRLQKKLRDGFPDVPEYRENLAHSYNNLGLLLLRMGRADDAENADRQAIDLRKQLVEEFPNNANYQSTLAGTLSNLAILLTDQGELAEAAQLLEEAILHQRAALDFDSQNPTYRSFLSKHYFHSAQVLVRQKKYVEAEHAYGQDIALMQKLASDFPNVPEYRAELATSYNTLGRFRTKLGRLQEAEEAFDRAITIRKKLIDEFPTNPIYQHHLAASYRGLGILLQEAGRSKEAEEALRQALTLYHKLLAGFPDDPHARHDVAQVYRYLGVVLWSTGRPREAEDAYRQAIDLRQKLADEFPDKSQYRHELAQGYINLGALLWNIRLDEAAKAFRQARTLLEELAKDSPSVVEYRYDLAKAYNNLGVLLWNLGQLQEAEKAHLRALDLRKELAGAFPELRGYRENLATSHNNLGLVLKDAGRPQEAEQAYEQAQDVCEKLAAEFPNVPDYQSHLGMALHNLAELLLDRRELDEARELLQQAIRHQQAALKSNPRHPTYRKFLRNDYWSLADVLVRLEDHREAAKTAEELPRVFSDSWEEYDRAARLLARCIQLAEKDTKLAEDERNGLAHTYTQRAKKLLREAIQRLPDNAAAYNDLAWSLATCSETRVRDPAQAVELAKRAIKLAPQTGDFWNTLGVAHYRADDMQSAIEALGKSMQLRSGGDANDWLFLAMIEWRLGNEEKAREWYDKSVEWMEKRQITSPELIRFRDEAANLLGLAIPAPRPNKIKLPLVAPRPKSRESTKKN